MIVKIHAGILESYTRPHYSKSWRIPCPKWFNAMFQNVEIM